MTINDFALPTLLESHLKSGGRRLSEREMANLMALMTRIDSPRPRLWGYDQIVSQHKLWSSTAAADYLGVEGTQFSPGRIDPERILIIGEADEDSPIALDYRTDDPRVLYLGGVGPQLVWIELASSYEALFDKLTDHAASRSPRILHVSWGRMEVDGLGIGRDFKLFPGGGREWDWTETNTHHVPGIQPTDVQELLDHGSETVVLTRGMQLVLQTCPETLQMLNDRHIRVFVEETTAGVRIYNQFAQEGEKVGGLFHSTC
jgi:hypothetical protein